MLSLGLKISSAKSKVSVSANIFEFKSYNCTRSRFWNKNLVDNKNSVMPSLLNSIFNLLIWSVVLFIIISCWSDLLFTKLGSIAFKYKY